LEASEEVFERSVVLLDEVLELRVVSVAMTGPIVAGKTAWNIDLTIQDTNSS
jgi:hypothetical protein